jgi:hypothetical protein
LSIHTKAITASPTLTADEAHVRLAAASGCSAKTFAGIFGGGVDLLDYHGWRLAMVRGDWTATKGRHVLRATTLGRIHAAVDKRVKRRKPPAASPSPRTDSATPVAVEARDVAWNADAGRFVWNEPQSVAHVRATTGMAVSQ